MPKLSVQGEALCQSFGSIYGNLANLAYGAQLGWMLTTALHLQTDKTHLKVPPIDDTEFSWLVSAIFLSGSVGILFIGWLGDYFGRKRTICMLSLCHVGSWSLYMFATNATELYIANIIVGLVGGGTLGLMPLFVAEIACDRIRGFLGSTTMLLFHIGLLVAFVVQYFLLDRNSTYLLVLLPIAFIIAFMYVPDTPIQLRKERRNEDALKSLKFYSGNPTDVEQKSKIFLQKLQNFHGSAFNVNPKENRYSSRGSVKALHVGLSMVIVQQLCISLMVLVYINKLPLSGMPLIDPNLSAIIFGSCHVVGSAIALLSDQMGRKPLMTLSSLGTAVSLIVLGLSDMGVFKVQDDNWVAYASIGATAFFASIGVLTLPPVIITETVPIQIRQSTFLLLLSSGWMLTFFVYKFNIVAMVTVSIFSFIVASLCLISTLQLWLLLPETKLKSYNEIVVRLNL